jgi:predicted dehydrogenase
MPNLKAALIGLGTMGKNHARVLKSLPDVDFVAVFDPNAIAGTSEFPIVSSLQELIQAKPDYCVIATPTFTHEELAITVAQAGIHILIEKPVTRSSAEATNLLNFITQKNIIVGVGHIERFNSAVIEAERLIDEGYFGEVIQISTTRMGPRPVRISDVGVSLDLGSHDIDLVHVLSKSDYTSVSAQMISLEASSHEDLMIGQARLTNGTIVSHHINWASPKKIRTVELITQKGLLVIDTLFAELTFYQNGQEMITQRELAHNFGETSGQVTKYSFAKHEPLLTEHQEFIKQLNGLPNRTVSLESAMKTIKVIESFQKSSSLGEFVWLRKK